MATKLSKLQLLTNHLERLAGTKIKEPEPPEGDQLSKGYVLSPSQLATQACPEKYKYPCKYGANKLPMVQMDKEMAKAAQLWIDIWGNYKRPRKGIRK